MFTVRWIDPKDGHALKKEERIKGGKMIELKSPHYGAFVLWIKR
jgi:hypothetical protein